MTIRPADSPRDFRHHGPVLVQEAASDSKLIALFPRLPRSYSPVWGERSGAGFRPANPR